MGKRVLVPLQKFNGAYSRHTCCNCMYFFVCGDSNKTDSCSSRIVKTESNKGLTIREVQGE